VKILLIPGDGVGSELAAELQKLISAVQSLFELKISTQTLDISELHFRDTNILVPKAFNKMAREADTIWLGPILNQSNLKGYTRKNIIQQICSMQGFEFYYRHFKPLPSLQKIQTDNPIDILLIENNFYSHTVSSDLPASFIKEGKMNFLTTYYSHSHLESLFSKAQEHLERGNRNKLHLVLPDELRQADSPWVEPASILADRGINVQWSSLEQFYYALLKSPDKFDLVLTVPPFGKIYSRLVSSMEGGRGTGYEFHQTMEKNILLHVTHPVSRHFVGKDACNPIGSMLSFGEFMNGHNNPLVCNAIRNAINEAINAGWVTRDLGGSMGAIEMGDYICSKLSENLAKS